MMVGASRSITADTPGPPNDSLYSLQPTRPSSVVIFKKSKARCPASACSDSTLAIFMNPPRDHGPSPLAHQRNVALFAASSRRLGPGLRIVGPAARHAV